MVLPGIQALFGFQTVAVFNQRFIELSPTQRNCHLLALSLVVMAVALLMAPAAYHRIVEPHQVSERTVGLTSGLICASLMPLAVALALDLFVVMSLATHDPAVSVGSAFVCLLVLTGFWFLLPLLARWRQDT